MTPQGPAIVIPPMSRVDRAAGRLIRERGRKDQRAERKRANRAHLEAYQALLVRLTQIHKTTYTPVDWDDIVAQGPVAPAIARDSVSAAARKKLADYRPSIMDGLLGLEREKRRQLKEAVVEAAKADAVVYGRALAAAEAHNRMLRLAPDVLALKPEALAGVLKICPGVTRLAEVVEGLTVHVESRTRVVAFVDLLEFDALPDEACTAIGPAPPAFSPIPHTERCELQLANACSVALRVAVEVLQVARVEAVEVVARRCPPLGMTAADLEPVLYVKVPAKALARLHLRDLEAAPTVQALSASVDWSASEGLAPISLDDLGLARIPPTAAAAA